MTQTGLQLLMNDGEVFKCYDHIHLTMFYSELGASKVIMDAGYTIDCLMLRWASSRLATRNPSRSLPAAFGQETTWQTDEQACSADEQCCILNSSMCAEHSDVC